MKKEATSEQGNREDDFHCLPDFLKWHSLQLRKPLRNADTHLSLYTLLLCPILMTSTTRMSS